MIIFKFKDFKKLGLLCISMFLVNSYFMNAQLIVESNQIRFTENRGFDYDPQANNTYYYDASNELSVDNENYTIDGRSIAFGIGGYIETEGNILSNKNIISKGDLISEGTLHVKSDVLRFSEDRGFDYEPATDKLYYNGHDLGRVISLGSDGNIKTIGRVTCKEIKVKVDAGADFVFENDYNLPNLDDIERFVKENKHLPNIAPALEMEKEGLELGEMNIRLLQKIEELTLYIIDQKNLLEVQENKNTELEARLAKIEKLLMQ